MYFYHFNKIKTLSMINLHIYLKASLTLPLKKSLMLELLPYIIIMYVHKFLKIRRKFLRKPIITNTSISMFTDNLCKLVKQIRREKVK